jgi:hypothetical protein
MKRWSVVILTLAISAIASPGEAQQWQVAREHFAFAGRQLTVHVDVESEGSLHVIRGSSGLVRVSGRSEGGMTAAGLTAGRDLTLTGSGPGPVEYIIAVPERVWLDIRFPDRHGNESMGTQDRSRTFFWGASSQSTESHQARTPIWVPEPNEGLGNPAALTVFTASLAPRTVALPDLTHVRSVTVRLEGSRFRIGATRPLALSPGDPDHLEIRPTSPPIELILIVPVGTDHFTLDAGGATALTVNGDQVAVLCSPSTRQWLSGGRGWVTFTPTDGALRCDAHGIRHET